MPAEGVQHLPRAPPPPEIHSRTPHPTCALAVAAKKPPASDKPKNVVAAAKRGSRPRRASHHGRWELVKTIVGTVAIFLFVRTFLIEAYRIPSGSMVPAMLVGDWLFVNKIIYGPHVPFTDINLPGYAEPARGDIVVFVSPTQVDQPWDPNPTLVKRLVGLPGDTIYMRDGLYHINGIAQRLGYGAGQPGAGGDHADPLFVWQKPFEVRGSRFGAPPAQPTLDNWGPLLVPPAHLFMLGDSRYNSKDGRYWGFVPRKNVRGRPLFVYYSYDPNPDSPVPWITDIRWSRIGHRIR